MQDPKEPLLADQAIVGELDEMKSDLVDWERALLERVHRRVFEKRQVLAANVLKKVVEIIHRRERP